MARCVISLEQTITNSALVLLILLQAALLWEQDLAAPVPASLKKNDVLAGTEFLSVFINGAMAPRPTRRRISLKYSNIVDNVAAESKNDEASIFRISRAPIAIKPIISRPREDGIRYYSINHTFLDNHHHSFETIVDDLSRPGNTSSKYIIKTGDAIRKSYNYRKSSSKTYKSMNQKIIGVSMTSTIEATPYKVRVEHHDSSDISMITHAPSVITTKVYIPTTSSILPTFSQPKITTKTMNITFSPTRLVTEEINNIFSESNKSQFSIEEGEPKINLQNQTSITLKPSLNHQTVPINNHQNSRDLDVSSSNSEPVKQIFEFLERNAETKDINHELSEVQESTLKNQGRKVEKHYEESSFNNPTKIYIRQNSKSYETQHSKAYSDSSKIHGESSKVYLDPTKVYEKPSKTYSEPSKVYREPEKIYSQPAEVYSKLSKIYGESAKICNTNKQMVSEPQEKNYEIDEAISVGSNGNIHGSQSFTKATNIDEDGHKVGYIVEGRNYRKYRVEERTPDGFIVGEYGVVSHDDGSLRGVRYTADGTINPRLIYDALMKFLAL